MTKVNKENWEYRKIGDLCTVISGSTPKTNIEEYWGPGYYWVTPAELGEGIYIDKTERMITDEALKHTHLTLLPEGTVLLSSRAPIGKVAITTVPMYCNQGFKNMVCSKDIYNKYLYWFLKHKTEYLQSLGRGATFKEISKKIVENIEVTYYNFNKQKRIAALFDIIDNLITIKQKQLKEFDSLESSVFYKMFGDLVYNDKNWDISDIGSICLSIIRGPFGSALKKEFFVPKGEHTYKVYEQKNAIQCNELIGTYYIDQSRYKNLERFTVLPGDIIMSCAGTIGKLFLIPVLAERGIINQALIRFRLDHNRINEMFFLFLMGRVQNDFDVKGCGLKNLGSVKDLKKMTFGLPPLSLQQSFAQKIEVIEKQKEVVKNEIAQLQALLDSEMDKYFG